MTNPDSNYSRSGAECVDTGPDDHPSNVVVTEVDRLSYVADLVLELKDMSQHLKAGTLTALLALAHAEAQLELQRRVR